MDDDHEVDWGNDEEDAMQSRLYSGPVEFTGGGETDDVEDAVSLGGDEEEEFAAYGARSNEQRTLSADKIQNSLKRDARRRSPSSGVPPRKDTSRVRRTPETPSSQLEVCPPTPKLTHALPPKPVLASSLRAPPSTTAASPMSLPRKERRSNGSTTKKGDEPSLSDRETRSSHTAARDGRHRDSHADEPSWSRPSPGAADSQPPQRDRTRSVSDRDSRPPLRREDDFYRPTYNQAYYSSDEEGREPDSLRAPSRRDVRYRYDDRDRHHDYASGNRIDRPVTGSARLSPEGESVDRLRTGYRESNDTDTRRIHPRDRDISPDSSRRVLRREDYPVHDSFDKGSRDYDDLPRSSGTAERPRYPESYTGRTNSVVLRDPHTLNQGPGRSSTLRRNSPPPRLRSRSPPPNRRDDRRHSPPRYQEYASDSSRLPPYRGRAETPPPRLRGPDRLDRRDTPPDVPQRRPRGISDAPDPDYAPKRRKMDDDDGNLPPVRRGPIGADTYIPLDAPTASTSPRSAGALDDLSRQRRREPLPSQSHRYKEASELAVRPPPSGSNRIIPQTQHSAQPPRHYPPSSRDHDLFPPRHPDTDIPRPDRSRGSGHDPVHVYVEKISRDDHMRTADPPYPPPRGRYEEPVRPQDMANRTSLHHDTISRGPIHPTPHSRARESVNAVPTSPIASSPMLVENFHGRSRDRSPRPHHEPRQTGSQPLSVSSLATQPGPPQDMPFIEAHRHHERRIDRDREGDSPTLLRNSSNSVTSRPRSRGRYDGPEGGQRPLRSPERNAAPSVQELQRLYPSNVPNSRRERQAPPILETIEVPPRVSGDPKYSPPLERVSRSGPSDAEFPPPPPPALTPSREWISRQPEFLSNLPPPSTRLPGAPPPPILPTHPYVAPRDPMVYSRLQPPHDENISAKPESEAGRPPPHEQYRQESPSPVRQTIVLSPRSYQKQEGRHEQITMKPSSLDNADRTSRGPAGDGLKENSGKESHKLPPREDNRPKVSSETIPTSWDVAPPPAPKPLALPASLPPKPVAALGDLNLQQSSSLRAGHNSHGRRGQQPPSDESNGHRTRWGPSRRGDGGKDRERERNRWEPAPEYRGPSLLARMSSSDSIGRDLTETVEREGGGEVHRKRARTRRHQAS